jgi:hypothetical protein
MTDPSPAVADDVPTSITATIGQVQYEAVGDFRQLGRVLAGMQRDTATVPVRAGTVTDTGALLRAAGLSDDEIAALVEEGAVA